MKRKDLHFTVGDDDDDSLPDENLLAEKYGLIDNSQEVVTKISESKELDNEKEIDRSREIKLQQKVREKNKQIENLCVLLETLEPLPNFDPEKYKRIIDGTIDEVDIDFRDQKIVQLAKKSQRITVQLNKERANNESLNQEILRLKKNFDNLNRELDMVKKAPIKSETKVYNRNTNIVDDSKSEEKSTGGSQKELKEASRIIDELKKRMTLLESENKNLQRTLTKEIGEGVSLDQAMAEGWKGRAQQIISLKTKIRRLESGSANPSKATVKQEVDVKAAEDIAEMSKERRQTVEALTEERIRLMESNQYLEKKSQAQKARIQTLETEVRNMKENIQMVFDKSASDDDLIKALRDETQRLKNLLKSGQKSPPSDNNSKISSEQENQLNQLETELQRLRKLCKHQSEQIDSQDTTIKQLRKKLNQY